MKLDPVLFLNHLMYFMSCVCVYSSRINRKHIQKKHIYIQEQLFASVTIDRRRIRTTAVVNQSDVLLTLAAYSSDVPAFSPPSNVARALLLCFAAAGLHCVGYKGGKRMLEGAPFKTQSVLLWGPLTQKMGFHS